MSSTSQAATSVQADIVVDVPQENAFRMFTERFDEVKPREHNLLAVPIERTVPERARVALEHRYLDRHGAGWESFTSLGEGSGWPLYLDRFRDATQRDAARA